MFGGLTPDAPGGFEPPIDFEGFSDPGFIGVQLNSVSMLPVGAGTGGQGSSFTNPSNVGLSPLVSGSIHSPTINAPAQNTWGDPAQFSGPLQFTSATGSPTGYDQFGNYIGWGNGPQITEDDDMGWISDVYTVVDAGLGGWLPGGAPVGSSLPGQVYDVYAGTPGQFPTTISEPPLTAGFLPPPPLGGQVANNCATDPNKGMIYTTKRGWHKRPRRRHKQLATDGDLKDLSALKGILGTGKAFEVWIATHA